MIGLFWYTPRTSLGGVGQQNQISHTKRKTEKATAHRSMAEQQSELQHLLVDLDKVSLCASHLSKPDIPAQTQEVFRHNRSSLLFECPKLTLESKLGTTFFVYESAQVFSPAQVLAFTQQSAIVVSRRVFPTHITSHVKQAQCLPRSARFLFHLFMLDPLNLNISVQVTILL